ncbi:MAG TPA: ABC transporter permease [Candidatus Binataceae bacterium]|nr:ABC transporter permease [Candidatus Binataceae bacterium]
MLRAIWLTIRNEARLLIKDPVVLFMLLFAPVVIITVAGYSLGALYGGSGKAFILPVVNHDHGVLADAILDTLRRQPQLNVEMVPDSDAARHLIGVRDRAPLALEIPADATNAIANGRAAHLILYVDPVRRIEADALGLRIEELCRGVGEKLRADTQRKLSEADTKLRSDLQRLSDEIEAEQTHAQSEAINHQVAIESALRSQIDAALKKSADEAAVTFKARQDQAWAYVQGQLARREVILRRIQDYLAQLQAAQRAFEDWLAKLKTLAGSRASQIPPPPAFPAPIEQNDLAELSRPMTPPHLDLSIKPPALEFAIKIPNLPTMREGKLANALTALEAARAPTLPGVLGIEERPALEGEPTVVNAFDQYVPGFGITFLLIGMMLGIALTLFDERDWGTLQRMRVSGAPLSGLLIGKLIARFFVGIAQMIVLFAVGWALFGISLGRYPLALLIPTAAISFASAALGLVIASIARSHDSVMPFGVTLSMAIAAIGGSWWPLDFEPHWMRIVARFAPTTWTMQSFNDLMIRNQPLATTLWPFLATVGLGTVFLIIGLARFAMLED